MTTVDERARRFGGIERLYGRGALRRLGDAHVAVVGVGGVGSWAVESLVRSGVGTLTLIDLDDICETNINRQLPATSRTVGRPKVDVLAERARLVHPAVDIRVVHEFFTQATAEDLFDDAWDWVVDAIDDVRSKCLLLSMCHQRGVGVVASGGAGGRVDPTCVSVTDLTSTGMDPLLRRVRKILRREFGFALPGPWGIPTVCSSERPRYPAADGSVCDAPDPAVPLRLDCASGFGTASFVTASFGLAAAGHVVTEIARGAGDTV